MAAGFCSGSNFVCGAVSYSAAGIDYMRHGSTSGVAANLANESIGRYINSHPLLRFTPTWLRNTIIGATGYGLGQGIENKTN